MAIVQNPSNEFCCGSQPTPDMATTLNEGDVISGFFNQGLFHVLELIFLKLDPESKSACLKVSRTWKDIVQFFYDSTNPRYKSSIHQNLSMIWAKNIPRCLALESAYLPTGLKVVQPMDLVMDDWNLFLSVLVKSDDHDDKAGRSRIGNKIVIFDSSDFSFVHSFDVDACFGFKSLYPMSVTLELSEDHLFVNVKTSKKLNANLLERFAEAKTWGAADENKVKLAVQCTLLVFIWSRIPIFDRQNNFSCNVVYKDAGLEDPETSVAGIIMGGVKVTKPIVGKDFVKFPIREHNYEDCSVAFHRTISLNEGLSEVDTSYTKLNTTLPVVDTVAIPSSKDFLVQEFDYKNNYLSKLGYYDKHGLLIWQIVKPKFYSKIIAVDEVQAAVLWQSGRVADGDRVDQIHLYNLQDGSLVSCMDINYTEIIGKGHLNHGRLAMRVMNICSRDVVILDLLSQKSVFSSKSEFHIDGHGSIIRLRENQFVMAVENSIYSLKY